MVEGYSIGAKIFPFIKGWKKIIFNMNLASDNPFNTSVDPAMQYAIVFCLFRMTPTNQPTIQPTSQQNTKQHALNCGNAVLAINMRAVTVLFCCDTDFISCFCVSCWLLSFRWRFFLHALFGMTWVSKYCEYITPLFWAFAIGTVVNLMKKRTIKV